MSLGKLLGAGKSFISGRKSAAYRTSKNVYLPQFAPAKNPFTPGGATATQVEPPKPTGQKTAGPAQKTTTLPWAKTRKISAAAAPAGPVRSTAWVSKLNPFRPAPADAGKNAIPVQAELSLERVRVMHNDLSDADVEVVPMKSRSAPEPLVANASAAKRSWEVLGERIMKATAL